jgi:hypothetical protein
MMSKLKAMDEYKGIRSRRIRVCPHCGNEAPQRLAYHHCPNLDAGARKKKKGKIEVYWLAVCDTCSEFSIWGDEVFGGLVAWHSREHFLERFSIRCTESSLAHMSDGRLAVT